MRTDIIASADPGLRFARFGGEILQAITAVMQGGTYILGSEVQRFEASFAGYLGTDYCVAVNSGTDAITLGLPATGIKPGDEVIAPAITFAATITAILQAGAVPVIVDVEPPFYCISPQAIRRAVTSKTAAILPVHLHGFAADMTEIMEIARQYGLKVLEDCAQAHGATCDGTRVGTLGDAAAFSFYPTKNLGCMGDGGAVVTRNRESALRLKQLRNYGLNELQRIEVPGQNSRLDEIQAAILNVLLPRLEAGNRERRHYAERYHDRFSDFAGCLPPYNPEAVYHQYPIRVSHRDAFREKLKAKGVLTGVHYPFSMKDHPAFGRYCRDVPVAEKVAREFVSLPIQPEILDLHFEEIANHVHSCLKDQ